MALGTHLARVRLVPKGVGVSYGHDWKATHASNIGLVPFGYADGMPELFRAKALFLCEEFGHLLWTRGDGSIHGRPHRSE